VNEHRRQEEAGGRCAFYCGNGIGGAAFALLRLRSRSVVIAAPGHLVPVHRSERGIERSSGSTSVINSSPLISRSALRGHQRRATPHSADCEKFSGRRTRTWPASAMIDECLGTMGSLCDPNRNGVWRDPDSHETQERVDSGRADHDMSA
jgi:hypothetical protein